MIVTVFGSASRGTLRENSDIDIGVAADRQLSLEQKTDIYMALSTAFERNIDLIDLNQVNGAILKSALCSGEIVIKRSVPILARLLKKLWYNQADMMPNTKMVMEQQIQRFIDGPRDHS
jgi:predicted nucleotidyltransferase